MRAAWLKSYLKARIKAHIASVDHLHFGPIAFQELIQKNQIEVLQCRSTGLYVIAHLCLLQARRFQMYQEVSNIVLKGFADSYPGNCE